MLCFRNGREVFGDAFHDVGEVRFRHGLFRRVRIKAGDGEELLHETRGAAYALLQAAGVFGAVVVRFGAREQLRLQLDACQRRPQFMSGVAREALLRGEAVAQPLHQVVDGVHEAFQLKRKAFGFERRKRRGRFL